ncbi:hypothetical protein ACFOLJ_13670 [Rugamonas sp. CCM 8940]|uniref:hypothetical protein n=1 Tax=Rugamonas sp. CCM 8940 TaxID=2765359 RepID=UPI0018F5F471|nr:hypothetical protein [Rugamonas sp. CCM 8940]MBJ7310584.1 hypothetical protein [Rugamonas sp. CCM 8940]
MMKRSILCGVALLVLGGCASSNQPTYEWGKYEHSLFGADAAAAAPAPASTR